MDTEPDFPVELGVDQGRGHLKPAANRGAYGVIDLVKQTGNRHEAVADRLDFVESMLGGDALENDEECIEPRHYIFRLMLVAIGGEVGHVAEQHRNILVAPWNHAADAADLVGDLYREERMQQLVCVLARSCASISASRNASCVLILARTMGAEKGLWM